MKTNSQKQRCLALQKRENLNPIENLWSIVKDRLRKMDCTTKIKLIEAVVHVWLHDEEIKKNCKTLVFVYEKTSEISAGV